MDQSTTVTHQARRPTGGPTTQIRVLFFGQVADTFGRSAHVPLPLDGCWLSQLRRGIGSLVDGGEAALTAPGVRASVDREVVNGDVWVSPGQEVAFFSAFSGG
jgi:molybdopterin converting factor small subunit